MVALVQWINEIYYDNSSGDVEVLVEVVVAPNMSSIDLSTVLISLYNGGNMMTYGTHSLNTCSAGDLTNGFQVYTKSIPGIQNDTEETTLSLDSGSKLVELLFYEGTFTDSGGPADGIMRTDIVVS